MNAFDAKMIMQNFKLINGLIKQIANHFFYPFNECSDVHRILDHVR